MDVIVDRVLACSAASMGGFIKDVRACVPLRLTSPTDVVRRAGIERVLDWGMDMPVKDSHEIERRSRDSSRQLSHP